MIDSKLATIVIPVYNRADTIVHCLDSIAMQKGIGQFAVITVDNNSTDSSEDVVARWAACHGNIALTQLRESRQSAAAARNRGLEAVTTPYVMFFDSDDEMLPGHLSRLLDGIAGHNDADIFGWDADSQLPDGSFYHTRFVARKPLRDHMIYSSFASIRYAVRTSFIRAAGAWDCDMLGWDDFELGVRLLSANPTIVKLCDPDGSPLARSFYSAISITGNNFSSSPEKWENALDKIHDVLAEKHPDMLRWVGYRKALLA